MSLNGVGFKFNTSPEYNYIVSKIIITKINIAINSHCHKLTLTNLCGLSGDIVSAKGLNLTRS